MIFPFSGAILENREFLITSDYKGNISLFNLKKMLDLINIENSEKLFLAKKKINLENSLILQMEKIDKFLFIRFIDKICVYNFDNFFNYLKNENFQKNNPKLEILKNILIDIDSDFIKFGNSIIFLKRKNNLNIYNFSTNEENIFFESNEKIISYFIKENKVYILFENFELISFSEKKIEITKINLKNKLSEKNLNEINPKNLKIIKSKFEEDLIFIIFENLIIKYNLFTNEIFKINIFPSFIMNLFETNINEDFRYLISLQNSNFIKIDENMNFICDLKSSNFESKVLLVEKLEDIVFVVGGSDGVIDVFKNSMKVFSLINEDN